MKFAKRCPLFLVLTLLLSASLAPQLRAGDTYTNPLPVDVADPDVLHHDHTYYLYGTTSEAEGFLTYSSSDLVHWRCRGFAFKKTESTWGRNWFWAPSIIEHRGRFYLFYSAVGRVSATWSSHRICVACSDSPAGPFLDVKAPLFDPGRSAIDPQVFIDSDGRAYLYYSLDASENHISEIYVVPLSADLLTVTGPPVRCFGPSQSWEGSRWNEAPYLVRCGDTYILMYSAQCYSDPNYSIGYATAPSPLGPWTKFPQNPILRRTCDVSGPGHNTVTTSPDGRELFILYHVQKDLAGGAARQLAMDRLHITAHRGALPIMSVDGPTHAPQPMPSNLSPTSQPIVSTE